jgi:hypothetical protein
MALTGPGWLGAHLLRQVTRSVGRGERVRPCRKQPNLGTEGLACLAVERREHLGLCCPQLVIQGREELDAELRRDDAARPPVAGIGTTLDQLGRLEIVEEVSHDRSIDSEVLGEGKLARHRALSRGGKDLVAPRTAGKVGDRGARGQGVRPQDNTQAPAEVACQSQLIDARVELILGSSLRQAPPTGPAQLGTFTVTTEAGTEITADIWFRCYGVVPNSDYLGDALAPARRSDGFIDVGPTLQVAGQSTVFALGDVSTADSKMAGLAGRQATIVADNINALAQGRSDLAHYKSWGTAIAVPIGPNGGAGQFPGQVEIAGPEAIAEMKGREMGVGRLRERFGLVPETGAGVADDRVDVQPEIEAMLNK